MARVSSISVCICAVVVQLAVTSTLYQINATGPAVVLQAIATLQQLGVFGNDNEILRRIAYVETRDGKLTINDGGIWAIREDKFLLIQNLENISIHLSEQIQNSFGINWISVQWRDLRIPLYSAIVARLILYLIPSDIPPANDLKAQATFWATYYNPEGSQNDFIGASAALQGTKCMHYQ